jgi:hypothetical protein
VEGIGVVGTVADDVFKEPGIVNDVELAPILAGTLAHNAGECRNNMLQPGSDSLRDPVQGGLDLGQELECGTGLYRVAPTKEGTGYISSRPTAKRSLTIPVPNHAGESHVVVLIADLMGGPNGPFQLPVVSTMLRHHVLPRDEFFAVIFPWR